MSAAAAAEPAQWYRVRVAEDQEFVATKLLEILRTQADRENVLCTDPFDGTVPFFVRLTEQQHRWVMRKVKRDQLDVQLQQQAANFIPKDVEDTWDNPDDWYVQAMMFEDEGALAADMAALRIDAQADEGVLSSKPYCLHIDIRLPAILTKHARNALNQRLARHINSYMLRCYNYDPRKYSNFFDVLLGAPNLTEMRDAGRMHATYYELWRVKAGFNIRTFWESFAENFAHDHFTIKVCAMTDEAGVAAHNYVLNQ